MPVDTVVGTIVVVIGDGIELVVSSVVVGSVGGSLVGITVRSTYLKSEHPSMHNAHNHIYIYIVCSSKEKVSPVVSGCPTLQL